MTRRVPPAPCPTWHLTDVSDSQSVPSHPVDPCRPRAEKPASPMPDPCTVIDADPVPARLLRRMPLADVTSTDHTSLTLPDRDPAVITTRRVPPAPCPTRHLTDVSDSQSVPSHPVAPCRPRGEKRASPMLDPCTVIDADPVPARLLRRVPLADVRSTDHTWLTLPARSPTVTTDRLDPPAVCPTRHLTDVSDTHSEDSHPDPPSRDLTVCPTDPMLPPLSLIHI